MVSTKHKMILSSGRFSGTSRKQLKEAFDALAASDKKTLVVHFHGGLVSLKSAETMAETLFPVYSNAGGYPLFVMWQSGLLETLKNNWQEILGEDVFKILVEKVVQFVLGKLEQGPGEKGFEVELPTTFEVRDEIETSQAAGQVPFADRDAETQDLDEDLTPTEKLQFENLLAGDAAYLSAALSLSRPDAPELNPELEADLAEARATAEPDEKGLISTTALVTAGVRILARTIKRLAARRDHGIYTTVVEEVARELKGDLIGGILWKHMKKDTADSFKGSGDTHGGMALLQEIHRVRKAGKDLRVVLVGHSAGSIYICNLLKKAVEKLPEDIKFEVVLLAPGCSFQLLDQALQAAGTRITSFRSFGMEDDLELKDAILPPLYMSSLLYFVSGLLEDSPDLPLVGMKRYHTQEEPFLPGEFPEIKRVHDCLASFPQAWIWSQSMAGEGLNTESRRHGDFDNEAKTLESLAFMIGQGGG
jgi:hypothetical protein